MRILKIAILDDEKHALDIISASVEKVFASYQIQTEIKTFNRGTVLLDELSKNHFDLIFLDIMMPEIDGVELGKRIVKLENVPEIVYVSSNNDRVFETFSVEPFGFVRKDLFIKDLSSVVERYIKKISQASDNVVQFEMKAGGSLLQLNAMKIKYVECYGNRQTFHQDGLEELTINSRMEILEEQLKKYGFIRVHKGYLVNCKYIERFKAGMVELVTGEKIPVGRTKQEEATKLYLEYIHDNGISIIG